MKVHDPVCGMDIDAEGAAARLEHDGTTYYFCCDGCRTTFEKDPSRYLSAPREEHSGHHHHCC